MAKLDEAALRTLLEKMPKPRAATASRLAELVDPCVTIKLDGVRALLVATPEGAYAQTLLKRETIAPIKCSALCVFDCERIRDHFYVFDAIFVEGLDVRHLPLQARLRFAKRRLPPCASLKRYHCSTETTSLGAVVQKLASSRPRLHDGTRVDLLEGFIFTSLSASYSQPPVKFKFGATCDFLVESVQPADATSPYQVRLYVQRMQAIEAFWGHLDAPPTALISKHQRRECSLPAVISLEDCIVLEMRLDITAWQVVRRRYDRARPNTLRTVMENLELQRSGKCEAKFLLRHLEILPCPRKVLSYVSDCMLRAVGECVALATRATAKALFLPDQKELENELEEGGVRSGNIGGFGVVAPLLTTTSQIKTRAILDLQQVINSATSKGWRCTPLQSLRASDFVAQNLPLDPSVMAIVSDAVFVALTRPHGTGGAHESAANVSVFTALHTGTVL